MKVRQVRLRRGSPLFAAPAVVRLEMKPQTFAPSLVRIKIPWRRGGGREADLLLPYRRGDSRVSSLCLYVALCWKVEAREVLAWFRRSPPLELRGEVAGCVNVHSAHICKPSCELIFLFLFSVSLLVFSLM